MITFKYKQPLILKMYLLVPTLWLGAMSIVSVMDSCRTASPRSAMAQVPFFFTKMFLDLRSRCAMPGFPVGGDHQGFIKVQIVYFYVLKDFFFDNYPVCPGSPCADVPDRWPLRAITWSSPRLWRSSGWDSQIMSHAHGSLTLATAVSMCRCLKKKTEIFLNQKKI